MIIEPNSPGENWEDTSPTANVDRPDPPYFDLLSETAYLATRVSESLSSPVPRPHSLRGRTRGRGSTVSGVERCAEGDQASSHNRSRLQFIYACPWNPSQH